MATVSALDLHRTSAEFAAAHVDALAFKVNRVARYGMADARFRAVADWANLIDDFVISSQALLRLYFVGAGSPEGVVTAPVGSVYLRTDGAAGTTIYRKETGTDATGWADAFTFNGTIDVGRLRAMRGTAVTSSNIALHANWGTGASQIVSTNSRATRGRVQITAGTSPGAAPTVIITWPDGAFATTPYGIVGLSGGSGGTARLFWSFSASALTITYSGTPTAGTYAFEWVVIG